MNDHSDGDDPNGIRRRTVAKAMVWALPVIAVAAPVPAFAASIPILQGSGEACKLSGASQGLYKGYALGISATNNFDVDILITITSIVLNGTSLGNLQVINLDHCTRIGANTFTVPANTAYSNLVLLTKEAGNSQAGTLTATYAITGGPGGTVTETAIVGSVPPLQSGECSGFTQAEKDCINNQNLAEA